MVIEVKKIIIIILCLLFVGEVNAAESPNLASVTNKCYVLYNNRIDVPVKIVSTKGGKLSTLIDEYSLGYMYYEKGKVNINIQNVTGDGIQEISVDNNRDSEGNSLVRYKINKDLDLKTTDELMTINFQIIFLDKIPHTYNLLGNEIIISNDSKVCENINGFKVEEIEREVCTVPDRKSNNMVIYIIIGLLIGLVLSKSFKKQTAI